MPYHSYGLWIPYECHTIAMRAVFHIVITNCAPLTILGLQYHTRVLTHSIVWSVWSVWSVAIVAIVVMLACFLLIVSTAAVLQSKEEGSTQERDWFAWFAWLAWFAWFAWLAWFAWFAWFAMVYMVCMEYGGNSVAGPIIFLARGRVHLNNVVVSGAMKTLVSFNCVIRFCVLLSNRVAVKYLYVMIN